MNIDIKKVIAALLAVISVAFAFAGCSDSAENETTTAPITTETAVIKNSDAVDLIKTYTAEELKLDGSLDDYKIMVNSNGNEIDGKYYIKVVASKVSEPDADGTVSIDIFGQYFISYDGAEILIYDEEKFN